MFIHWSLQGNLGVGIDVGYILALRQKLDCYLNNNCLDDQVTPDPTPLTPPERERLYSVWRQGLTVGKR